MKSSEFRDVTSSVLVNSTTRRNTMTPASKLKSKEVSNEEEIGDKQSSYNSTAPEDRSSMFLRNVVNFCRLHDVTP
jgi:replicative superfamily II helicase